MLFSAEFGATRCQSSSLLPGVQLSGTCESRENELCNARCDQKGMMIWQRKIQCLNGKWTPTPFCEGTSVVKTVKMINCDSLPVKVRNSTVCMKITETFTGSKRCPDLLTLKLDVQNCSREAGSICKVSCGKAYDMLKCLSNGKWSHVPKCKTVPLKVCPVPKIGKILDCSRKEGEICKVIITTIELHKGINFYLAYTYHITHDYICRTVICKVTNLKNEIFLKEK